MWEFSLGRDEIWRIWDWTILQARCLYKEIGGLTVNFKRLGIRFAHREQPRDDVL